MSYLNRHIASLGLGTIVCTLFAFIGVATADLTEVQCPGGNQPCRNMTTNLALRALPRSMSNIYAEPDTGSEVLASNIKAFWPVYVFERKDVDYSDGANPTGWYQVGSMDNDPMGWMQARDILEWKQALVISYKHPGSGDNRRQPVLMFKTRNDLASVAESADRAEQVAELYAGMESSPPRIAETLISREPRRFVSIEQNFYMLPVIDFEKADLFEDETRYLQIAAAVPTKEGETRSARAELSELDTLTNANFLAESVLSETVAGTDAQDLVFDIKFVMDMTGSMGPYIERTKQAIQKVAQTIGQNNPNAKVRYGLIGYRDDVEKMPALEFTVRNFTPEPFEAEQFLELIGQARAAEASSGDYQEEGFAGLREAVITPWSPNSIRIAVMVGDASSHPVGHPQNTTGLDAQQVRDLANAEKVSVISMHLKEERASPDHPFAEAQYRIMATNPGSDHAVYLSIPTEDHDEFERAVKKIAEKFSEIVAQVRQGDTRIVQHSAGASASASTASDNDIETDIDAMVSALAANALVEYLGSAANPPRDITAWIMDRDLTNPNDLLNTPVDVRVLLKKKELNDLIMAMENTLKAFKRAQLTGMQFFDALRGVLTNAVTGSTKINVVDAKRLADSGMMPEWLASLPYRSALLEMSNELWESLAPEERSKFEYDVEAKLKLYQEINENSDLWVALDTRDASLDHVYPLPLTTLP